MSELSYKFTLRPHHREAAFLYVFFIAYPRIVAKFFFGQRPSLETFCYILFSPLLVLRNFVNALLCTFLFLPDIPYKMTLHESHLVFGLDDERFQMANSYDNVIGIFEVGRSLLAQAGRGWIGLMRDGYIFYLPSSQEGHAAIEVIKSRRAALK